MPSPARGGPDRRATATSPSATAVRLRSPLPRRRRRPALRSRPGSSGLTIGAVMGTFVRITPRSGSRNRGRGARCATASALRIPMRERCETTAFGVADISRDQFTVQKGLHVWPPMVLPALRVAASSTVVTSKSHAVTAGQQRCLPGSVRSMATGPTAARHRVGPPVCGRTAALAGLAHGVRQGRDPSLRRAATRLGSPRQNQAVYQGFLGSCRRGRTGELPGSAGVATTTRQTSISQGFHRDRVSPSNRRRPSKASKHRGSEREKTRICGAFIGAPGFERVLRSIHLV